MDEDEYEDEEVMEIKAMPFTREDAVLPFVQMFEAAAKGVASAMSSLRATLVSASIYRAEQKMTRAQNEADAHAMERTAKELSLLDASAFEES